MWKRSLIFSGCSTFLENYALHKSLKIYSVPYHWFVQFIRLKTFKLVAHDSLMNLEHLVGLYLQMELSTVKIMACEWAKHNTSKFFITHMHFFFWKLGSQTTEEAKCWKSIPNSYRSLYSHIGYILLGTLWHDRWGDKIFKSCKRESTS